MIRSREEKERVRNSTEEILELLLSWGNALISLLTNPHNILMGRKEVLENYLRKNEKHKI